MLNETIETRGRTTKDGTLNLSIQVGAADTDVEVTVQVRAVSPEDRVDTNGWPIDFFERAAGSMPDFQHPPQDKFDVTSVLRASEKTQERQQMVRLTIRDRDLFLAALEADVRPNRSLCEAAVRFKLSQG